MSEPGTPLPNMYVLLVGHGMPEMATEDQQCQWLRGVFEQQRRDKINLRASSTELAALQAENEKLRGLLAKWYEDRAPHHDVDSCCLHLETAEALKDANEA